MTDREQIGCFEEDLERLVPRYRDEFQLSVASAVGVLFMKAQELTSNAHEDADGEEEA